MNRRTFLRTAVLSTAVLFFPIALLTGCDTATVADFVTLIGEDAASLATYFGVSSIASQITTLAGTIATDITNWQAGGAAADAIEAINDLIGLVNQIPVAVSYAPVIILILSALTGLLALLPGTPITAQARARAQAKYAVVPTHYPDFSKKSMTSGKRSFDSQFKKLIAQTPGLTK